MRVFFDCEFEDLGIDAGLISIGLVTEHGAELYAELTDTWHPERCSDFVRKHVLPLLDGRVGQRMSRKALASQLFGWLRTVQGEESSVDLVADSNRDWVMLHAVFADFNGSLGDTVIELRPEQVTVRLCFRLVSDTSAMSSIRRQNLMARNFRGRRHHALADALALRAAVLSLEARRVQ